MPALTRGLRLLAQFNRETKTLTGAELSRRLGLSRTTVFRLLATLEAQGCVERVEGEAAYRLSLGVLRLGFDQLAVLSPSELTQRILNRLRDETGLNCSVMVRDGISSLCVGRASAPSFAMPCDVGSRIPLHQSAWGMVLLADLSSKELAAVLRAVLQNDATVAELEETRRIGFVLRNSSDSPAASLAVPVRSRNGRVTASLGIALPIPVTAKHARAGYVPLLATAAEQLAPLFEECT